MPHITNRRDFIRHLGLSAAAAPFILNLPSLGFANNQGHRKQRLVIVFSPNGVVPWNYWPDEEGECFAMKESCSPLIPFQDQTLFLKGVSTRIRGDGDSHMRGIGCLLTGIELFPGNIQGGSDTPAGWSKGHSIDQEIKGYLQSRPESRTRFGSLEFGVMVPERADTWTRMVYAGANKPIAPVDDPYQMFKKLYGQVKDQAMLASVLDEVRADLSKVSKIVSAEDRRLIEEHATFVRDMEEQLKNAGKQDVGHAVPKLEPGLKEENDNMPRITKMQIELMVSSFLADATRIATLQITNSVGGARMTWLGINDSHHELSHKDDKDTDSQNKLTQINKWYCEQVAYLAKRLSETPEPGAKGSMLDHTTIIWTNELGAGNSHTLDNIPYALIGGGLGFRMGRSVKYKNRVSHNRLLMTLAHAFGHEIKSFGNPEHCKEGPLTDLA